MCLLEGYSVREVDNLHLGVNATGIACFCKLPVRRLLTYRCLIMLADLPSVNCSALFVTANYFKTHQFHHIGDVTLET